MLPAHCRPLIESSGLSPAGHLSQLSQDLCQSLSTARIGFTLEFIVTLLHGILEVRSLDLIDLPPKFHDSFADIIRMDHGISNEKVLIVVQSGLLLGHVEDP